MLGPARAITTTTTAPAPAPAPGTPERLRADTLMRLERRLFSDWMGWLTTGYNEARNRAQFESTMDVVARELDAAGVRRWAGNATPPAGGPGRAGGLGGEGRGWRAGGRVPCGLTAPPRVCCAVQCGRGRWCMSLRPGEGRGRRADKASARAAGGGSSPWSWPPPVHVGRPHA